jgi:hypothetical protein
MLARLSRLLKASTAVVLIAAFSAWQPAMSASMALSQHGSAHAGHGSEAPQPDPVPLDCCTLCVLACAGAPGVPGAAPGVAPHVPARYAQPRGHAGPAVRPAPQYRLPFPIGPPHSLLA